MSKALIKFKVKSDRDRSAANAGRRQLLARMCSVAYLIEATTATGSHSTPHRFIAMKEQRCDPRSTATRRV
jgi:hypothetical protein